MELVEVVEVVEDVLVLVVDVDDVVLELVVVLDVVLVVVLDVVLDVVLVGETLELEDDADFELIHPLATTAKPKIKTKARTIGTCLFITVASCRLVIFPIHHGVLNSFWCISRYNDEYFCNTMGVKV